MTEIKQQYLTIGRTAKRIDVQPHILRYWEKKIPQIKPVRINGRRFYTREHVDILNKLRVLHIDQGYTLEGASKMLFGRHEDSAQVKQSLSVNQAFARLVGDLEQIIEILA